MCYNSLDVTSAEARALKPQPVHPHTPARTWDNKGRNTMKTLSKLKVAAVSLMIALVMLIGMSMTVSADRVIPSKVRGYPDSINTINLQLNAAEYIKVTSAKNLKYKITSENWSTSSNYNTSSSARIEYYTAKKGTYSISVAIYSSKTNKKLATKTIKAFVQSGDAIKNVLVNGKDFYKFKTRYTTAKSVTFKVVMNSGYTLKKLEVGTYGSNKTTKNDSTYSKRSETRNEMTYKTFKNGGKITLGTKGYYSLYKTEYLPYYEGGESYVSYSKSDAMTATTEICITYLDKYSKEEKQT